MLFEEVSNTRILNRYCFAFLDKRKPILSTPINIIKCMTLFYICIGFVIYLQSTYKNIGTEILINSINIIRFSLHKQYDNKKCARFD